MNSASGGWAAYLEKKVRPGLEWVDRSQRAEPLGGRPWTDSKYFVIVVASGRRYIYSMEETTANVALRTLPPFQS
jgi:hypothetical protein